VQGEAPKRPVVMGVESRDRSTSASPLDEMRCKTACVVSHTDFVVQVAWKNPISDVTRLPFTATKFERRTACCVVTPRARAGCAAKRRQSPWASTGVRNGSVTVTHSRPPAGNAATRCLSFARGASQKAPAAHEQAERSPVTSSAAPCEIGRLTDLPISRCAAQRWTAPPAPASTRRALPAETVSPFVS
jgi:hypothetical protein